MFYSILKFDKQVTRQEYMAAIFLPVTKTKKCNLKGLAKQKLFSTILIKIDS